MIHNRNRSTVTRLVPQVGIGENTRRLPGEDPSFFEHLDDFMKLSYASSRARLQRNRAGPIPAAFNRRLPKKLNTLDWTSNAMRAPGKEVDIAANGLRKSAARK